MAIPVLEPQSLAMLGSCVLTLIVDVIDRPHAFFAALRDGKVINATATSTASAKGLVNGLIEQTVLSEWNCVNLA
jgi:hypothetical protein